VPAAFQLRHPPVPETEEGAARRPRRDFDGYRIFHRRDVEFTSERRLRDRKMLLRVQIIPIPRELFILGEMDDDKKISRGTAAKTGLAGGGDAKLGAFPNARWDPDRNR
jgi:hypothetical protein